MIVVDYLLHVGIPKPIILDILRLSSYKYLRLESLPQDSIYIKNNSYAYTIVRNRMISAISELKCDSNYTTFAPSNSLPYKGYKNYSENYSGRCQKKVNLVIAELIVDQLLAEGGAFTGGFLLDVISSDVKDDRLVDTNFSDIDVCYSYGIQKYFKGDRSRGCELSKPDDLLCTWSKIDKLRNDKPFISCSVILGTMADCMAAHSCILGPVGTRKLDSDKSYLRNPLYEILRLLLYILFMEYHVEYEYLPGVSLVNNKIYEMHVCGNRINIVYGNYWNTILTLNPSPQILRIHYRNVHCLRGNVLTLERAKAIFNKEPEGKYKYVNQDLVIEATKFLHDNPENCTGNDIKLLTLALGEKAMPVAYTYSYKGDHEQCNHNSSYDEVTKSSDDIIYKDIINRPTIHEPFEEPFDQHVIEKDEKTEEKDPDYVYTTIKNLNNDTKKIHTGFSHYMSIDKICCFKDIYTRNETGNRVSIDKYADYMLFRANKSGYMSDESGLHEVLSYSIDKLVVDNKMETELVPEIKRAIQLGNDYTTMNIRDRAIMVDEFLVDNKECNRTGYLEYCNKLIDKMKFKGRAEYIIKRYLKAIVMYHQTFPSLLDYDIYWMGMLRGLGKTRIEGLVGADNGMLEATIFMHEDTIPHETINDIKESNGASLRKYFTVFQRPATYAYYRLAKEIQPSEMGNRNSSIEKYMSSYKITTTKCGVADYITGFDFSVCRNYMNSNNLYIANPRGIVDRKFDVTERDYIKQMTNIASYGRHRDVTVNNSARYARYIRYFMRGFTVMYRGKPYLEEACAFLLLCDNEDKMYDNNKILKYIFDIKDNFSEEYIRIIDKALVQRWSDDEKLFAEDEEYQEYLKRAMKNYGEDIFPTNKSPQQDESQKESKSKEIKYRKLTPEDIHGNILRIIREESKHKDNT